MNAAAGLDHVPPDVLAWFKITGVHMELKALREVASLILHPLS